MFAGIALVLILGVFCVQLLFCFRVRRPLLRWLPVLAVLLGEALCWAAFGLCIWMERAGKGIYGGAFAAYIYGLILLAMLTGAILAWLVWAAVKFVQKRRK